MTNEQTKQVLEAIASAHEGLLLPEDVVDAASASSHPLHDRFEWDDAKAGRAHRLDQARAIIRSVHVVVSTTTRQVVASWYTHDPMLPPGESGYVSAVRVASAEDVARAAVAAEFGRASAALERARDQALTVGLVKESQLADRVLAELAVMRGVEQKAAA